MNILILGAGATAGRFGEHLAQAARSDADLRDARLARGHAEM